MDYVIFNEVHRFYHEKKNSENPILARFSDRREVTKINQAKRKSLSPQAQRYLGAWNVTG